MTWLPGAVAERDVFADGVEKGEKERQELM